MLNAHRSPKLHLIAVAALVIGMNITTAPVAAEDKSAPNKGGKSAGCCGQRGCGAGKKAQGAKAESKCGCAAKSGCKHKEQKSSTERQDPFRFAGVMHRISFADNFGEMLHNDARINFLPRF